MKRGWEVQISVNDQVTVHQFDQTRDEPFQVRKEANEFFTKKVAELLRSGQAYCMKMIRISPAGRQTIALLSTEIDEIEKYMNYSHGDEVVGSASPVEGTW